MTHSILDAPVSPLRQRVIDDMNMRRFSRETQRSAMTHHPHVHMIVPGGGIALDGNRWISSRPACPHPPPRFPVAGAPSPTAAAIRNPHSHRASPAGSFLGDFRTPASARNSSGYRVVRFWGRGQNSCRLTQTELVDGFRHPNSAVRPSGWLRQKHSSIWTGRSGKMRPTLTDIVHLQMMILLVHYQT